MIYHPVQAHERFRLHGHDPGDLVAAPDHAAEYVTDLLASLRAPWVSEALCRGEPVSWFFPGRGESTAPAMELCGRCPVRLPCLEEAIADETLDFGVRGGATANARRVMRANRLDGKSSLPDPDACPARCKCDNCKDRRAEYMRRWRHRTGRSGPR